VSALLKRGCTILNRYWILFDASTHLMSIMGENDYRTVLDAVQERARERERRVNEELRRYMEPRGRRTRG
jgi:hypothetical protein